MKKKVIDYKEINEIIFKRYNIWPTIIPELIAVKNNLKKLSAHIVPAEDKNIYDNIKIKCQELGINTGHSNYKILYDYDKDEHRHLPLNYHKKGGDIFLFISKDKNLIKDAVEDYINFENKANYYLSYPNCCIKNYRRVNNDQNERFIQPLEKTKQPSFLLNNLTHWENPLYLISHFPCSYRCKKSINYASKLLECIEKEFPEFSKILKFFLTRPTLYNGFKSHVSFNGGFANKNELRYNQIYATTYKSLQESLFEKQEVFDKHHQTIDKLKKGDRLIIESKEIKIFSSDTEVGNLIKNQHTCLINWHSH